MTVRARETYVERAPVHEKPHLGVVRRGARLLARELVGGSGCPGGWYRLVAGGYVCNQEVAVTRRPPGGPRHPVVPPGRLLPFRYVAVGEDGSGEYLRPEDAASDYFVRELAPRHAVTVSGRERYGREVFYRTTRSTYVPASEVHVVRASRFAGEVLRDRPGEAHLPLAFVHRRRARIYRRPGRPTRRFAKRFERHTVLQSRGKGRGRYHRVGEGAWLRHRDVRLARGSKPPEDLDPAERWIDVQVSSQTLVAYQGTRPVFATLVSTGRRGKTPIGEFRVWIKLAATDMRSGPGEARRPYQLWDVPWTVFFKGDFALHGTYWHNRFGFRKSAGCVNLSPRDARWVFDFVRPELRPGWWAVLPLRREDGSRVRIRK